jgi:hypothetical protein
MHRSNRYDAGNPLQPGNALKNKNFDKIIFRYMAIAGAFTLLFALLAIALYRGTHRKIQSVNHANSARLTSTAQPLV